jgi:tRNA(fMet)-specific endonuclease VapC
LRRLLDTNAYVGLKLGHEEVAHLVRDADALVFSLIVVGELMFGFRNGTRYRRNVEELEAFLAHPSVKLLSPSWVTADRFGRIATALKQAGTPIPTNDIWIAAQAFESGAELITFDKHFGHVAGLAATILSH